MEESENSRIGDIITIIFVTALVLTIAARFLFGWTPSTQCPYRDRSGEWVDDCE